MLSWSTWPLDFEAVPISFVRMTWSRKELGPRASTIFPVPCRQAVYAGSEEEQKQANIQVLGKSLAKQSISIIPKIRELDEFMDNHLEYRNRILESHPELAFTRLSGSVQTSSTFLHRGGANYLMLTLPWNILQEKGHWVHQIFSCIQKYYL